jgi:hypothetical protein
MVTGKGKGTRVIDNENEVYWNRRQPDMHFNTTSTLKEPISDSGPQDI